MPALSRFVKERIGSLGCSPQLSWTFARHQPPTPGVPYTRVSYLAVTTPEGKDTDAKFS